MSRYISEELRQLVIVRAKNLCEYCLIDLDDTFLGGEIDHIIGVKHSGLTTAENLAQACQCCNRNKGSDLGSIYWPTGQLLRFFNPCTDRWADHFVLDSATIRPLTEIGEVTARILGFNSDESTEERAGLVEDGHYPSPAAQRRMSR